MITIKLHIDTKQYSNKPSDFATIKPRLQNDSTITEIELSSLIKKIEQGYSISPAVMKNGINASNWSEQSLFMIDIDNNDKNLSILTVPQALAICRNNNLMPIFYYYTFNHSKQKPKYRLAFLMDKPIVDNKLREQIITTLISLFPQSDTSCKNADRIFLGTNKQAIIISEQNRITIDDILKLSTSNTISNNHTNDKQLNELKFSFDLLSYMCKDNEISHSTDDITYFKTCSICGHRDCLRYYHTSNTFYCFGANGTIGGSIIDYLMATEHLSKKQAIDKLKNELCNLPKHIATQHIEYISARELQNTELFPTIFYVENMFPQGLTLICSVPKLGKSWLALQLCIAISTGTPFLGFNTKQCNCLYLALEDSKNRIKNRMDKLLDGKQAPNGLFYTTRIDNKDVNNGLIEALENFLQEQPTVKVIVIDTLQKIRGLSKTSNVYANDYKELSIVKSFADKHNLCIILIHHLKKGIENNDVFERVSGTNGITGTADTTIVLSKNKRSDIETQLSIVGRDVEFNEYMIKFNKETCIWEMISTIDDYDTHINKQIYNSNQLIKTIKHVVKVNNGEWKGTLKELNFLHKKLHGELYYPNEISIKKELNKYKTMLLEFDGIEYIPSKNPTSDGRIQTFKKV